MNRRAPDPRLFRQLRRQVGTAVERYQMIAEGDLVMVCLSGGKDSYLMLDVLMSLQRAAPVDFELIAVNLDQKQPGFPEHVLPEYLERLGVRWRIVEQDTYSIVKRVVPEGKTMCSLCSRLRRGVLYRTAEELGASKIALGHHREDAIETLFLNMFNGGTLKTMPPALRSDDGRHVVIRPLYQCREKDIARYARGAGYPIIPCDLCGSQEHLARAQLKRMLAEWDRRHPGRLESLARSITKVTPSHLADDALFDFAGLSAADGGGVGEAVTGWLKSREILASDAGAPGGAADGAADRDEADSVKLI
ncbi:MAG: tRNA 2-thiocytidine(32) synthetase TtcA [Gammaproteobacteria bacterium AqS3]|nr:tRNA 2-thiocytidine(32) synthetase TtcA [Gammaproteobacteria bacterium AqS3]